MFGCSCSYTMILYVDINFPSVFLIYLFGDLTLEKQNVQHIAKV